MELSHPVKHLMLPDAGVEMPPFWQVGTDTLGESKKG
jgi:hypothetical protein